MMTLLRPHLRIVVCMTGVVSVVGCQAPRQSSDMQTFPRITNLYERTTAPPVHRTGKRHRGERDRLFGQLSAECDHMIAEVHTWERSVPSKETNAEQQKAMRDGIHSLRSALKELRNAAAGRDENSLRSAHSTAAAAYDRVKDQMAPPGP